MKKTCCFLASLLLVAWPLSGVAGWAVDSDRSSISYLSTKMTAAFRTVFESNRFKSFSGGVDDTGEAVLDIDLSSVDTGVQIRDERVREHVFDVRNHPRATIKLPVRELAERRHDAGYTQRVEATLTMRGVTREVRAEISVARVGDELVVQTTEPVLVNAVDYGMLDGFGRLKELVGLFNIPTTIPVSFKLVLVRQ